MISAEEREELRGKVKTPCFAGVEVGTLPMLSIAIAEEESDGLFVEVMSVSETGEVFFFIYFFSLFPFSPFLLFSFLLLLLTSVNFF